MLKFLALSATFGALLFMPSPGGAQSVVSAGQSFASAELLPGRRGADGTRHAGLAIDLAPGWKTYWRSPGETGVPPRFDWTGSENVAAVEVLWPRPIVFDSFGMRAAGYADEVVLPLAVTPASDDVPLVLRLDLTLGVCREICVLEEISLETRIPPHASEGAALVDAALSRVPAPAAERGLLSADCRIEGAGMRRRLTAQLAFAKPVIGPDVLIEAEGPVRFRDVHAQTIGHSVVVDAEAVMASDGAWVSRDRVRMTVLGDGGFAARIEGCTRPR